MVLFKHDNQDLRMITLFTHDTLIYAWHHTPTNTQLFTHNTWDLRKEELDLRMIHHLCIQLDLRTVCMIHTKFYLRMIPMIYAEFTQKEIYGHMILEH